MPQVFKIGAYWVYFWSDAKAGKCLLANNNSQIPETTLKNIIRIIEARSLEVIQKWEKHFGEIRFYC